MFQIFQQCEVDFSCQANLPLLLGNYYDTELANDVYAIFISISRAYI